MKKQQIILASTSARRRELMELLRLPFEVVASDYEEDMALDMAPEALVQHLALGKARAVVDTVGEGLVIGGDTIIVLESMVMGKPHTPERAREMLRLLRGKTHQVMTGLAVIDAVTNETRQAVSITDVTFTAYTDKEIDDYVATGEPLDRAGAYAIQGYASLFLEEMRGDYFGVLGLSVVDLARVLKEFDVDVWEGIAVN
ncbi:septum formation inhibitor Maf [Candidatus Uhrbacteria bacterium CG10_big_fil_rev_8_21_14_0_10_50_16]|uniref:dTTP/UTP pyrophosphatase n=1 Tax=Candidatus Uhrbacteria bacterium CG10_big_fil_rev_8_21_14_0_10_50_16 TaxID=1975039 RepID=A0A2H0RQ44_9BACT|nr:MAG: septum formation inhibitor Maf [Candidatus Uhrbacteria bacterium CG10_big_fil_rev_8_21_14_0_10_50_16]